MGAGRGSPSPDLRTRRLRAAGDGSVVCAGEHRADHIWAKTGIFLFLLFLLLGSGVWIGLALMGVAYIGVEAFTARPAGDAMITTIWTSSSSWTLTALPLFIWMGEILFRTRLSEDMFKGLAPWMARLPGGLLHTNVVGCTIFAAVSGSSAATLMTVGKMVDPGAAEPGVSRVHDHRNPRGLGDPGSDDSAFADPHRVRGHHQRIDHEALHRRYSSGPDAGAAVHGLRRCMALRAQGPATSPGAASVAGDEAEELAIPCAGHLPGSCSQRLDVSWARHPDGGSRHRRHRGAGAGRCSGQPEPDHLHREPDGRRAHLRDDRLHPDGCGVSGPQHGIHRPSACIGRMDRFARPVSVHADRGPDHLLHHHRMFFWTASPP